MAYRALARTAHRERARRGLEFVGLDPHAGELLRLVTTGLSPVGRKGREGEFLLTCPRQNTGRGQGLHPPYRAHHRLHHDHTGTPRQHCFAVRG